MKKMKKTRARTKTRKIAAPHVKLNKYQVHAGLFDDVCMPTNCSTIRRQRRANKMWAHEIGFKNQICPTLNDKLP